MSTKKESTLTLPPSLAHLVGLGSPYSTARLRAELLKEGPTAAGNFTLPAEVEINRLGDADLPVGCALHHIGATAVPGLPALPTLDFLLQTPPGTKGQTLALQPLGYVLLLSASMGHPIFALNRSLLNDGGVALCFIHVAPEDSVFARRALLIRDILRKQPKWFTYYRAMRQSALAHKPECYRTLKTQFFSYLWAFHSPDSLAFQNPDSTPKGGEVAP